MHIFFLDIVIDLCLTNSNLHPRNAPTPHDPEEVVKGVCSNTVMHTSAWLYGH